MIKRLIKGSKEAKLFMAKIRAKKGPAKKAAKKIGSVAESKKIKKELAAKKIRLVHGYKTVKRKRKLSGIHKDTKSHNVKISVLSGPAFKDPDSVREIELFLLNDSDIYFKFRRPVLINLAKKHKKGTFKTELAAKSFLKVIEAGMKKYNKDFGSSRSKWSSLLSVSDRKLLALDFAAEALNEFNSNNYEY